LPERITTALVTHTKDSGSAKMLWWQKRHHSAQSGLIDDE
jgi:hypothetical protein